MGIGTFKTVAEVMESYKSGGLTMSQATAEMARINAADPSARRTRQIQMNASGGLYVSDPSWLVTSAKTGGKYVASVNLPYEVAERLFTLDKSGKPSEVFMAISKWIGEQTPETVMEGINAAQEKKLKTAALKKKSA